MKALVFNPYWDSLGGGERYTSQFIKLLLDKGWQVDIIWPEDISSHIRNRFSIDISKSKFVDRSTIHKPLALGYNLLFWVSDGSLPTSFAGKTIIHFQFPFHQINGSFPTNFFKSRFYTFVSNSQFTRHFIDQEFHIRSRVIYPPISTDNFPPGKKNKTIIYVGRFSHLTQKKQPDLLISTFKEIADKLSGWELVLAGGTGPGTTREYMDRLTTAGLGFNIRVITNPVIGQLQQLYAQSSIFWSASGFGVDEQHNPTQVEHFGISVVEAMSAGCVPIICNVGGHKEIITSAVDGFLYDSLDQLKDLTLQLAKNPGRLKSLSINAVKKSKIFDVSAFNQQFVDLLDI